MTTSVRTRPPRHDERYDIQAISTAAGLLFADHRDHRIAARAGDPPPAIDRLAAWIDAGRAWVSVDEADEPVGFVLVDVVDQLGHVEEVSVRPDHQGRGHGTALLDAATEWCLATLRPALTLTTFDDVDWNRPYYERRGFRVLEEDELGPELLARVRREDADGLASSLRVCMRRDLD